MLIIDRFENDFAVIETDNGLVNIPRSELPAGAAEGDVLLITIAVGETEERKERIDGMMNKLFKNK